MRGATLALMIVVNMSISEAKSYGQLLHAPWHGLTLTDLVFPSFLFVMGAAMSVTLPRYEALGAGALWARVLRRAALIFLCGFLLYWFPFLQADPAGGWMLRPLAEARILGVLQRIALTYLLAVLVLQVVRERGALAFCVLALLANWWLQVRFGDYSLTGNAALALDRWLLGEAHLYHGEGLAFDPEGLLGTLPATVNVLAGHAAARWLQRQGAGRRSLVLLALAGLACLAAGAAWGELMPINKKLWTSSYVMVAVGVDLLALAGLTALVDVAGVRRGTSVFSVFGKNTLALYLLAEIGMSVLWLVQIDGQPAFEWVHAHVFEPWLGAKPGSLAFALGYAAVCWWVGWWMGRRGVHIRL